MPPLCGSRSRRVTHLPRPLTRSSPHCVRQNRSITTRSRGAKPPVEALSADPARPVADIAAALGVSHGPLDRQFTGQVGLSPRTLARILQNASAA